jgi:signal peptidase I
MEPLIHTGDLVVVRAIAPGAIQVGDVITFPHPDGSGRLLTHRVRDLAFENGIAHVTTKGDAATGREEWDVPLDGSLGRVEYRVWKAGYVIAWFKSAAALLAAGVVAALALTGWVLVGIWRPEPS